MADFKLSAQLSGHEADVRAVCFASPDLVLSASRDRTVRAWHKTSPSSPKFEDSIVNQATEFVNSLTFIRPSLEHRSGLVISAGADTIIDVRKPSATPTDNAERLLLGHAHNVCTLDVSPQGKYLVSGGWDGQARVWSIGKWQTELLLTGHEGKTVWAVLAWDENVVVTGCADTQIRIFDLRKNKSGEADAARTIPTPDVVRGLCRAPKGHSSGADFASASNDGIIRLWKLSGQQVGELHGHESYIYSLAALPSGELVSSGEDRTVRIWRDRECVQTITHPAISVWTVSACAENGDIVTGASDGVARVFTRSNERVADQETVALFEDAVKSSAIPHQQMDGINKEKLPGPEFLKTRSGTKEGQVQLIKEENGSITAHQWSMSAQQWANVGTVVDAAGSSGRKVEFQGQSYDFVFDVDIEEGKPALKLPYNLSENPYERATKFLGDNELPMTYLDEVANFIVKNTKGATLGQAEQPAGPDPYGTEARYRPDNRAAAAPSQPPPQKTRYLPHKEFLALSQAKFEPIQKKIISLNDALVKSGQKDHALNPTEEKTLASLVKALNTASADPKSLVISERELDLVIKLSTKWAYKDRLPGLDLLRCTALAPAVAGCSEPSTGASIVEIALSAAFETGSPDTPLGENLVMMALRTVANLFASGPGRASAVVGTDKVLHAMECVVGEHGPAVGLHNRNVGIALTSAAFNYMALAYGAAKDGRDGDGTPDVEVLTLMCNVLQTLLAAQSDSEVAYRALMALGMALAAGGEYKDGLKVLGVEETIRAAVKKSSEARVREVGEECLALLR